VADLGATRAHRRASGQEISTPRLKMRLSVLPAIALVMLAGCAREPAESSALSSMHVVDLGHALAENDPSWDNTPVFSRQVIATIDKDGYDAGRFASDEHFGTHLDAPAHFARGGWTVDEIPVDRLIRPAVCVNVERAVHKDVDYRLTVDDLTSFEREHGRIPEGAVVLIATGWDARWSSTTGEYMNMRDGVRHFPGLSVEAASMLAKDRHVAGIGIDTPSIDYGPSEHFEAHQVTLAMNLFHIENATGLTHLPATGFTLVVAPIKIKGGSGAPARVFALLNAVSAREGIAKKSTMSFDRHDR